jgi:hypothetical protein
MTFEKLISILAILACFVSACSFNKEFAGSITDKIKKAMITRSYLNNSNQTFTDSTILSFEYSTDNNVIIHIQPGLVNGSFSENVEIKYDERKRIISEKSDRGVQAFYFYTDSSITVKFISNLSSSYATTEWQRVKLKANGFPESVDSYLLKWDSGNMTGFSVFRTFQHTILSEDGKTPIVFYAGLNTLEEVLTYDTHINPFKRLFPLPPGILQIDCLPFEGLETGTRNNVVAITRKSLSTLPWENSQGKPIYNISQLNIRIEYNYFGYPIKYSFNENGMDNILRVYY